jgi:hypothetical protein
MNVQTEENENQESRETCDSLTPSSEAAGQNLPTGLRSLAVLRARAPYLAVDSTQLIREERDRRGT